MELKNGKGNSKLDIKKELISEDLSKLLTSLIIFLLMAGIFGYIGYIYSKDNNLSINHGIIFGIIFPLGVGLLELLNCDGFFSFILYTIVYLLIISYLPTFVGGIILLMIVGVFILDFIYIKKKDRTKEIEEYYNYNEYRSGNNVTAVQDDRNSVEDLIREQSIATLPRNLIDNTDENTFKEDEEEFECEMCFKKISEEEYELYDCMCEECFIDAHTDKYGNYHDEEYFDK